MTRTEIAQLIMKTAGLLANSINDFSGVEDKRDYYFYPSFKNGIMYLGILTIAPFDGRQKFTNETIAVDLEARSKSELFLESVARYISNLTQLHASKGVVHRFFLPARYLTFMFTKDFSKSKASNQLDEGMMALRFCASSGVIVPCTLLDEDMRTTRRYAKGLHR